MLLILSIVLTLVYIFMVWFDLDRTLNIWWSSLERYTSHYLKKPLARQGYSSIIKVVIIIPCNQSYCDMTLKSILDQSVQVDAINIQTDYPDKFNNIRNLLPNLMIKQPAVDMVGERDKRIVKIKLLNGKVYSYDFVESFIKQHYRT